MDENKIMQLEINGELVDFIKSQEEFGYKDGKWHDVWISQVNMLFGNCLGVMRIMVDEHGNRVSASMPMFNWSDGYESYTLPQLREMKYKVVTWEAAHMNLLN